MITTRMATAGDIPSLVAMLTAFMKEAFDRPWSGSPEALARDGLGERFEMMVAVAKPAPGRALEDKRPRLSSSRGAARRGAKGDGSRSARQGVEPRALTRPGEAAHPAPQVGAWAAAR